MRSTCPLLPALLLATAPWLAQAEPAHSRTLQAPEETHLTLYANGRALVRERYQLRLPSGGLQVVWDRLPREIDPQSVVVGGGAFQVSALDYDRRLLTPKRLLAAHVGELVRLIRIDPATGQEIAEAAEILSVQEGLVVRIGDQIVSDPEGQIVFSQVPRGLHPAPVLRAILKPADSASGPQPVELAYLTGGLQWRAEYALRVDPAGGKGQFEGWASVENRTEHDFGPVRLALVAGALNDVGPQPGPRLERMALAAAPPTPEHLSDAYRIYRFETPWPIAPHSLSRRPLLAPQEIELASRYIVAGHAGAYTRRAGAEPERQHAVLRYDFELNSEILPPLPAGRVQIFGEQAGDEGGFALLGIDHLPDTPKGAPIRITAGRAFDVWAERRQTDYRVDEAAPPHRRRYVTRHQIRLHNMLDHAVTVWVEESIPGQWKILEESDSHFRLDAHTVRWSLLVQPDRPAVLTYKVQVTQ